MEIRMIRGDLNTVTFTVTENGETPAESFDNIYMTVKKAPTDKNFIFQKSLGDDTIVQNSLGEYLFTILPEDTDGMIFGEYVFDIEFIRDGTLKKTFCGTIVIDPEVTHHNNEGE